jgi:ribonucleoside-diphosphate reductase alpha chain
MQVLPQTIRKRDESLVSFDNQKIWRAIYRAAFEVLADESKARELADGTLGKVLEKISLRYANLVPSVENIQDTVEETLMEEGNSVIARSYILYREEHKYLRQAKKIFGIKDDLKLPLNSLFVLKNRYLLKNDDQQVIETPRELFQRVAKAISQGELNYKSPYQREEVEATFLQMMTSLKFMPNSPTLMNAGTELGQLSACFVLPVEDSIEGIFETLKNMARIHQTGGGTGFDFSRLRPRGDIVSTTKGEASGPVSFMSIFNQATGIIVQGGRRRGANMGILRCDHPDIVDFIQAKQQEGAYSNFNLSVAVTDAFMDAVRKNGSYDLINPRNGKKVKSIRAKSTFDLIVHAAWRSGDPGLVFLDEINRHNPTPVMGKIEATNPCGEIPLLPYESCNLASVNLAKFVNGRTIDWEGLKECIWWGVRFLDDVIEVNKYPLSQIKEITFANRKIGLGVMGFADMLIKLGIPYTDPQALTTAKTLMQFFQQETRNASMRLARERGAFPAYEKSIYPAMNLKLRNATVNTVAPTGTISIICGCSSGIEPLFALSYVRNVLAGAKLFEVHQLFAQELRQRGLYHKDLMAEIGKSGSIQQLNEIPEELRKLFVIAFDISPDQHLEIQAAFQQFTDNSVSKTINLPPDASIEDVAHIYLRAHELKCKGITIYRYGTKENQVLSFGAEEWEEEAEELITADAEYSGGCFSGTCVF